MTHFFINQISFISIRLTDPMYDFIKSFLCLFIVSAWDIVVQYIDVEGTNLGREKNY